MNDENAKPRPRRLSAIVQSLEGREEFSIGTIVDELGERAFGALMFIFAVPNVVPTPPGTSAILGLPLVILTFQLMVGRQTLWLPDAIRRRRIDPGLISSFVRRALPTLVRFEKILKPRLSFIVLSNLAERVVGLVSFLLAIVLFMPIPFGNILPAAAIALLALGLAERDGLAASMGYALSAATVMALVWISSALYAAVTAFIRVLFGA